jgi:hypothetical protein
LHILTRRRDDGRWLGCGFGMKIGNGEIHARFSLYQRTGVQEECADRFC